MADRLDKLLSDYFTGRLATNIRLRKMDLQFNSDRTLNKDMNHARKPDKKDAQR